MAADGAGPGRLNGLSNRRALRHAARFLSPHKVGMLKALGAGLVQGRREGVRIWDLDGNELIDCRSAGGVFNLGHRPAAPIAALSAALEQCDLGDWLVPSARRARAAEALGGILPGRLRYTFFTTSGGEAVDVACKLARLATGRPGIVCAERAYHGQVGLALAMTEDPDKRLYGPLVPGVTSVPFGDVAALEAAVTAQTAAVCLETIPASSGIRIPPDGYLTDARRICDAAGALLVLDEVQAGLGRTGRYWACEHWGVAPDLLVSGKGLAGGVYPVAACCFGDRVEPLFAEHPFFHPSSFGGSELGAAVVEAVVEAVRAPDFLTHVERMGSDLHAGLSALVELHPDHLRAVRGRGLMLALETASEGHGFELARRALANGLLANFAHNDPATLLVMPPLVVTHTEVDEIVARLDAAVLSLGGIPSRLRRRAPRTAVERYLKIAASTTKALTR